MLVKRSRKNKGNFKVKDDSAPDPSRKDAKKII